MTYRFEAANTLLLQVATQCSASVVRLYSVLRMQQPFKSRWESEDCSTAEVPGSWDGSY